jgi:hypothetical protein
MSDHPRKRRRDADGLNASGEEVLKRSRIPVLHMLGVISKPGDVLATNQASQPEPRLVGDGQHEIPAAHPRQLRHRRARIVEMLENLEAEHEIEGSIREVECVDALLRDLHRREPLTRERNALRADVDAGHPIREAPFEPGHGLPLAAPGVQHGVGTERLHQRPHRVIEAVDHAANHRITRLELGVVGGIDLGHRRRGTESRRKVVTAGDPGRGWSCLG